MEREGGGQNREIHIHRYIDRDRQMDRQKDTKNRERGKTRLKERERGDRMGHIRLQREIKIERERE